MKMYQVIHQVIEGNPAGIGPKEIAARLGICTATLYKWGEDPDNSGSNIPAAHIIPFCTITRSTMLLAFLAGQIGYTIKKLPPIGKTEISEDILFIGEQAGILIGMYRKYFMDNVLDENERASLCLQADKIIRALRELKDACHADG